MTATGSLAPGPLDADPGSHQIGFVVNPIAGMGGRVGLKGTDDVVEQARAKGAEPSAQLRALETLRELRSLMIDAGRVSCVRWLTCSGSMGADWLTRAGFEDFVVSYRPAPETTAADTCRAVECFLDEGAELILFCGGDGTARDVRRVSQPTTPLLGIPAGVKMYSGVFGVDPRRTARILFEYLEGDLGLAEVEILDIDEQRFRRDELAVRLYATAHTPFEPTLTQETKAFVTAVGDREVLDDIADDVIETIDAEPETLFLLGPGGTVATIARRLGIDKTLLGVDAVVDRRRVGVDLDELRLLELLDAHQRCVLVLSPIGAQGFVLGRGNQQLSRAVVRRIGPTNIVVVATPAKLQRTPVLRFDTGDRALDEELAGASYLRVVTGHHLSRLVRIAT